MYTWVSADMHFGDERLSILGRPFQNATVFMNQIIENYNSLVKEEDEVIFNGDVVYKDQLQYLPMINKIHGKKTLIRGNHDRWLTDEQLKPYFDVIIPDGDGLELEIEGIPCYITHYPTRGRKDRFNLVSHVHSAFRYQLNMFNVGLDVNHFYPVNLSTIPKHLKSICEFYDQDVWCAYNEINSSYIGKRGKAGSYFQG